MTASQFAQLLHARRIGKGKWIAKCAAHPDKQPSLAISEGRRGVVIRCMSAGCDTRDILAAMGMTYSDLFYDSMTPQVRARTSLWQLKEELTIQWQSARMLAGMEKRNYWLAVEKRIKGELLAVRCRIEPVEVYREWRGEQWRLMNLTQREAAMEGAYERYQARGSATDC